ncbi:MAG TPA: DUF4097 family beta strand repeat-containing protein, partial [Burkholderiales bacterium]|nr:DUF4097 family beta strand repeat-containing protein [Burkholderiales bacterium]
GDVYIEGSTMTFSTGGVIIGGSQLPDTSVALTITVPVAHDVIIDAVAGDVHLHGQVSQDVIISTATGAVTLHESAARVSNIETQSGDITIASVPTTARVVATSQSGDVKVGGVRGRLLAETMSGDITATAIDPSTYTIQLSSMAGDIYLGPAPSARMNLVQATTMSGRVLPL